MTAPRARLTHTRPGSTRSSSDAWMAAASCRKAAKYEPDVMYQAPSDEAAVQYAKSICARCPVITQCRTAVDRDEAGKGYQDIHGVWAGMSEDDRCDARGIKPRPKTREPARCGTEAGYERHRRLGETACAPCKAAHSQHTNGWQKARRKAARQGLAA